MTLLDFNPAKHQIMWVPRPARLRKLQKLASRLMRLPHKRKGKSFTMFLVVIFVLPMKYVCILAYMINEFVNA